MKKLLFAVLLIAGGVSVVPTPVASAMGPCYGVTPAPGNACWNCIQANPTGVYQCAFDHAPPPVQQIQGPGRNQHCNSVFDGSGNDNRAAYTACCHDVLLGAGGPPC